LILEIIYIDSIFFLNVKWLKREDIFSSHPHFYKKEVHSINLILLAELLIIIFKLNTFLCWNSICIPDLSILAASSDYSLREQNTCFSFFLVQMHHTQPLRCVEHWWVLCAISHDHTNVSNTYYCKSAALAASMRVYMWYIPACHTWLKEQSRGNWTFYEVRRRRRCEKEDGGKLDGGEGVWGGEVKSCLLLCGVLERRYGGARGPKKPDGGKGEGARPCRAAASMMMMTVVVTVVVVVEGGSRRWKGREKERDGEDETQERRRESPAQRGPVRCMADLETRSPQGETRGPKRRPRRIERNSRESWLFLFHMLTIRARSCSPSATSVILLYLALTSAFLFVCQGVSESFYREESSWLSTKYSRYRSRSDTRSSFVSENTSFLDRIICVLLRFIEALSEIF